MKKVALTLAGVIAAAAFAPEASAVPAFARQTGMACDACHFQSYPLLSGFGRAFKAGGYTMMGSQGKIEGEHGLSIPAELNSAVYLQHRIQKKSGNDVGTTRTQNSGLGRIDFPDEFSLFFAGRVSEGIGAVTEVSIGSGAAGLAGTKMVFSNEIGDMKAIIVPFTTSGLSPSYGFDVFGAGSNNAGRVMENQQTFSGSYLGTAKTAASGATLGVVSEAFHVTYTPWVRGFAASNNGTTATALGAQYIRAAVTPTIAGFEAGFGVQIFSGQGAAGITGDSTVVDKATLIDAQAQGEVAGMPIGIYASYGSAPASTATEVNFYNASTTSAKTHMGAMVDLGVIPHTLMLQAGLAFAKTGNQVAGSDETDNAIVIGARYKLRQNVKIAAAYSLLSGTAYDAGGSKDTTTAQNSGKTLLNLILSAAF